MLFFCKTLCWRIFITKNVGVSWVSFGRTYLSYLYMWPSKTFHILVASMDAWTHFHGRVYFPCVFILSFPLSRDSFTEEITMWWRYIKSTISGPAILNKHFSTNSGPDTLNNHFSTESGPATFNKHFSAISGPAAFNKHYSTISGPATLKKHFSTVSGPYTLNKHFSTISGAYTLNKHFSTISGPATFHKHFSKTSEPATLQNISLQSLALLLSKSISVHFH